MARKICIVSVRVFCVQVASQVGALDLGYTAGLTADSLSTAKCLYLLGAVSCYLVFHMHMHDSIIM